MEAADHLRGISDDETIVLAGLMRLMVRMDGVFSAKEADALAALGRRLEHPYFWRMMAQALTLEMDELSERLDRVALPHRGPMLALLIHIAEADGLDDSESQLLAWLRGEWGL